MPGAKVEAVFVDLADLSTIRTFANKALDGGAPLDVLVNNAGELMSHIHMDPACKVYQIAHEFKLMDLSHSHQGLQDAAVLHLALQGSWRALSSGRKMALRCSLAPITWATSCSPRCCCPS